MILRKTLAAMLISAIAIPGASVAQPFGTLGPDVEVQPLEGPVQPEPDPRRLRRDGPPTGGPIQDGPIRGGPMKGPMQDGPMKGGPVKGGPVKGGPGPLPSAVEIQRKLEAPVAKRLPRNERVTIREFKRRPELRRAAPSIDIQAINFPFGSAEIPYSQFGKVEVIADAIERMLRRNPDAVVLIEGHTDAVGSFASNQRLSEARAATLKRVLVREFGVPSYALDTVGYGEEFLLVPTQDEDWRNRRVTLIRADEFLVR